MPTDVFCRPEATKQAPNIRNASKGVYGRMTGNRRKVVAEKTTKSPRPLVYDTFQFLEA